jgi:DNA-directed RNA polymerase subunit RPC12/RpoP
MKSVGIPLQFACFHCRKSFKRPQFSPAQDRFMTASQLEGQAREAGSFEATREHKCPDCGGRAHFMGKDFKAPRKRDLKGWAAAQAFIESGRLYYRGTPQDG